MMIKFKRRISSIIVFLLMLSVLPNPILAESSTQALTIEDILKDSKSIVSGEKVIKTESQITIPENELVGYNKKFKNVNFEFNLNAEAKEADGWFGVSVRAEKIKSAPWEGKSYSILFRKTEISLVKNDGAALAKLKAANVNVLDGKPHKIKVSLRDKGSEVNIGVMVDDKEVLTFSDSNAPILAEGYINMTSYKSVTANIFGSKGQTSSTSIVTEPKVDSKTTERTPVEITKPLNRIKIRGNGEKPEFYDSVTGKTFTPIGFNHTRLDIVNGIQYAHVTFENDYYNTAEMDDIFKRMSDNNHNVIRVWFDHIWNRSATHQLGAIGKATNEEPVDKNYLDNIIDFLRRARANNVYVLLCMDHTPRKGIYGEIINSAGGPQDGGLNPETLHEGMLRSKERYLQECLGYIKQTDPSVLSTVFSYQLDNEMSVRADEWPFNINGKIKLADGIEYDMTVRERRQAAFDNNYKLYANRMDKVIKSIDPETLTCTGLYTPYAVGKISNSAGVMLVEGDLPGGDKRYPVNVKVLLSKDCNLDFVDIHLYSRRSLKKYLDSIDWDNLDIKAKPIMLGEYGEWKRNQPNKFAAAGELLKFREEINSYGIIGGLVWLWNGYNTDTDDGAFYTPVNTENLLTKVLDPEYREEVNIMINNNKHCFDQPATVINSRTMVPLRGIFEVLGAKVDWNADTSTVTAELKNGKIIKLKIGDNNAYKDNELIKLDQPAIVTNGRTLVPVRFVAESADAIVDWDGNTNSVIIRERDDSLREFKPLLKDNFDRLIGKPINSEKVQEGNGNYKSLSDKIMADKEGRICLTAAPDKDSSVFGVPVENINDKSIIKISADIKPNGSGDNWVGFGFAKDINTLWTSGSLWSFMKQAGSINLNYGSGKEMKQIISTNATEQVENFVAGKTAVKVSYIYNFKTKEALLLVNDNIIRKATVTQEVNPVDFKYVVVHFFNPNNSTKAEYSTFDNLEVSISE